MKKCCQVKQEGLRQSIVKFYLLASLRPGNFASENSSNRLLMQTAVQVTATLAKDFCELASATPENVDMRILARSEMRIAEQDSTAAQLANQEEALKLAQENHDRLDKSYQECKAKDTALQEAWKH